MIGLYVRYRYKGYETTGLVVSEPVAYSTPDYFSMNVVIQKNDNTLKIVDVDHLEVIEDDNPRL